MSLLKTITVSIGWLSGSLAGLGAILYAFGFLVTRAQSRLLGIEGVLSYGPDVVVHEGALFVLVVGRYLLNTTLALTLAAILVSAVVYLALSTREVRGFRRLHRGCNRIWQHAVALHGRLPWRAATSGYVAVLGLLLLHAQSHLDKFEAPSKLANLLYQQTLPTGQLERDVMKRILDADTSGLELEFVQLIYVTVYAVALTLVAWRLMSGSRLRGWLIVPFVTAIALYTLHLPMAFGVIARPTRYNVVLLQPTEAVSLLSGRLYLLNKSEQDFVVWDATRKRVLWIPKQAVTRVEVMQVENLFGQEGHER